jgi:hypothetical protein
MWADVLVICREIKYKGAGFASSKEVVSSQQQSTAINNPPSSLPSPSSHSSFKNSAATMRFSSFLFFATAALAAPTLDTRQVKAVELEARNEEPFQLEARQQTVASTILDAAKQLEASTGTSIAELSMSSPFPCSTTNRH